MFSLVGENREHPIMIYEVSHENEIQYISEDELISKHDVTGSSAKDHEEDQKCSLPVFQAALFVKILEVTLKQIQILAECNNELRVTKALWDMPVLLTYKYQVVQPGTEEYGAGDIGHLNSDNYKLKKLDADRKYVNEVIMSTLLNLKSSQNYDTLTEEIHKIESGNQDFIIIFQEEAKNKQLRRELYKQLRNQRNHFKTVIYDANAVIEDLKSNVEALWDMPVLLTYKYQVVQPGTEEYGAGDIGHLNSDNYKLKKLDADRKYVNEVIMSTLLNLKSSQNYDTLTEEIHKIESGNQDFIIIFQEEAKNKQLRRELYKQLRNQRNHFKTVIYDANAVIEDLKSNVEDYCLNAETQIRYIENWQRARSEQNDQSIHDTESLPSGIIEYYKQRLDQEQRVHSEIELLINILINETSEKVEDWMNKYDKDMENIDLKIQFKKNDYQATRERRLDLEMTLDKHDTLMKEWTHFKEEREKARLYTEMMTKSAIIVQAWWRGLLVRRELGPYKVSKKKARKGKKT